MSTEQPTLGEAIDRRVQERRENRAANVDGARYRGAERDTSQRAPDDAGCCRACGEPVGAATQRVVGDNHGRVPACKHCAEGHETTSTAALDARLEGMLR